MQFVQATGHPIRYIDAVFAAYGQATSTGAGIQQGICVKNSPRCDICGVTRFCQYFSNVEEYMRQLRTAKSPDKAELVFLETYKDGIKTFPRK